MKKLNKKGFTLIEMLIVIAIIAIMVAIIIPTVSSALETARQATDLANIRSSVAQWEIESLSAKLTSCPAYSSYLNQFNNKRKSTDSNAKLTLTFKNASGSPITSDLDKAASVTVEFVSTKLKEGNGSNSSTYTWTVTPLVKVS